MKIAVASGKICSQRQEHKIQKLEDQNDYHLTIVTLVVIRHHLQIFSTNIFEEKILENDETLRIK